MRTIRDSRMHYRTRHQNPNRERPVVCHMELIREAARTRKRHIHNIATYYRSLYQHNDRGGLQQPDLEDEEHGLGFPELPGLILTRRPSTSNAEARFPEAPETLRRGPDSQDHFSLRISVTGIGKGGKWSLRLTRWLGLQGVG